VTQDLHSGPGDLAPGEQLAGYEIQERIGRGGMAVVYRALDLRLGRLVALKVLAPHLGEDEAFRQRFMRESRAAAGVDHPHIIPVFEAGEAGGVLFIAMRYVAGGDVRSLIEAEGRLSPARTARITSQVASALDAAHARGLVHRDVKPANILLGQASGSDTDHVYLSDFGLSKHSLTPSTLTSTGQFLGTLDYVSPEQIQGHPIDGRADQYALACAVAEMLTGAPPFRRDDTMALMWAQLEAVPPRLTERRPELPPAVDDVIAAALSKSPGGRFATCRDFAAALAGACEPQLPQRSGPRTARAEPVSADPFPTDPFLASAHQGDRFGGDRFGGDRFADDRFADDRFAGDRFAAEGLGSDRLAGDGLAGGRRTGDAFAADGGRFAGDRVAGDRFAAEGLAGDRLGDDAFPAGANQPDRYAAGGLGVDRNSRHAGPEAWSEAPGDWFRGGGSDPGPGAAQNGPVPAPVEPFRQPSVHAAWPATAAPPTRRDGGMPGARPQQPGPGHAGSGRRGQHHTRNVVLGLLIAIVGLCGIAGIVYKLSHRTDRTLPPATATKTVTPGISAHPALTVREYFAAINHKRYLDAWRLSGETEPYATFRAGYAGTMHDTVTILSVNGNIVTARLVATQTTGKIKTFQGTYTVTNGVISGSNVHQVS
jgi:hypothetical protein